ncbi:MAG: LPS assembly lipoprotein LptE [Methylocystis sp.]
MWWFSKAAVGGSTVGVHSTAQGRLPTAGLRRMTVLFVGLLALPLASCLQPLYAPAGFGLDSSPLAAELQSIAVDEIPLRLGHYVRNELIFGLNGTGSQPPPRYRLTVVLRERVQTPILDTVTGRATSATVIVDAEYRLITIPDEVEVTKGVAFNIASYDRFSNRFSNVRAARDAEIRDARVIAESIRTRVATVMADRLASLPPPVVTK